MLAHVHRVAHRPPAGCAIFFSSHPDIVESSTRAVPADSTAAGFYISNGYNYVVGNAASGGWAGFQFPVLPEPADVSIRFRQPPVEPSKRPILAFHGNSAHSSAWWTARTGAVYVGGGLFYTGSRDAGQGAWVPNAASSELRYSPGRIGTSTAEGDFFPRHYQLLTFHNTTVALDGSGTCGALLEPRRKGPRAPLSPGRAPQCLPLVRAQACARALPGLRPCAPCTPRRWRHAPPPAPYAAATPLATATTPCVPPGTTT